MVTFINFQTQILPNPGVVELSKELSGTKIQDQHPFYAKVNLLFNKLYDQIKHLFTKCMSKGSENLFLTLYINIFLIRWMGRQYTKMDGQWSSWNHAWCKNKSNFYTSIWSRMCCFQQLLDLESIWLWILFDNHG